LGRIGYAEAFDLQQRLVEERKRGAIPDQLLLLEHPHTITLGRNGRMENLLAGEPALRAAGIVFHASDRGGDITYHGPGQLVGYPILDLKPDRCDVHRYVRDLEEVLISAVGCFGLTGHRLPGLSGVWVGSPGREAKLAAVGVRISRWVTSHGFALNVNTNLEHFGTIVPCGISDRGVTSLERLLGHSVPLSDVEDAVLESFRSVFV